MFNIESQGVNANLIYTLGERDEFETTTLGMISNNKIKGVIPVIFSQMDEIRFLKYNISGKIPLSEYFKGNVSKRKMLGVLSGISEAIMAAEEYMVDTSLFIMDQNYIFIDSITGEIDLICLPILNANIGFQNASMFFKQLVCGTQIDLSENCDYVAKLISFFNVDKVFSISEFRLFVETLNSNHSAPSPAAVQQTAPATVVRPATNAVNSTTVMPPVTPAQPNPQPSFTPPAVQDPPVVGGNAGYVAAPPVPVAKPAKKTKEKKKKGETAPAVQLPEGEKPMSIFTLLTKYSKENLEIYKAQKAAGQTGKSATNDKKEKAKKPVATSFAVPNQPDPIKTTVAAGSKPTSMNVNVPNVPQVPDSIPKYTPSNIDVKSASFGETTVLGVAPTAGETTVLNAVSASKPMPYLVRNKNNERIVIDKPCFRIGKERSYVDYFISDNPAISRSHADIISNSRGYFIIDRNSTNHTFVNGVAIQSETEVKIEPGCKIKLANDEFDFVIG